jgi:hypothetical protein
MMQALVVDLPNAARTARWTITLDGGAGGGGGGSGGSGGSGRSGGSEKSGG